MTAPLFSLRKRLIRAGLMAGVGLAALSGVVACVPANAPSPGYEICNTAGCGDNVAIEIVNGSEPK